MNIINLLFYWSENNRYVFSRTKFITWIIFLVTFISFIDMPPIEFGLFFSLLIALFAFLFGFIIHKLAGLDSSFYTGGLGEDIKHFLLYWYTGRKFRLAKTKIVTLAIIVIGILNAIGTFISGENGGYSLGVLIVYVMIAMIAFAIGFIIHKLISKDETPVPDKSNTDVVREENTIQVLDEIYSPHLTKANELKRQYDEKELKTKELINAKFAPPQITYDKFMAVIDNCHKIFADQYDSLVNLIKFTNEDSVRIDSEINDKMANMNAIIDKLDDLSSELVINMSKTNDDDLHNVLGDMESLISSINDYED
ncbi:MAG: hypothetical protein IJQ68_02365 [Methanobrevibacter sp.]|uniref:hypothetical protein n=1 Tax=Methanobrevibacter sp. TaxID=66852 RepID=UPI0025F0DB93|nr:hypothetical protein [Methanobrevibacter sp.]MBR0270824.1 hypothetical protein [Methanobrevibacter sp.]